MDANMHFVKYWAECLKVYTQWAHFGFGRCSVRPRLCGEIALMDCARTHARLSETLWLACDGRYAAFEHTL